MASGACRRLSILAAMVALLHSPSRGQLRADEIATRAEWEVFLASAKVVGRRQITGPEAVTEPWVLTLRSGPIERQALWKDVDGKPKGILDCWRYEIAAYRLDKALGLGMIPATVERRDGARRGSCQLYSPDAEPLRDRIKTLEELTPAGLAVWRRGGYVQQAFDNLIGNSDRSQGNILLTPDWRWVLIDHSRAFRTEAAYTKELPFTEKTVPGDRDDERAASRLRRKAPGARRSGDHGRGRPVPREEGDPGRALPGKRSSWPGSTRRSPGSAKVSSSTRS
ncbi:MAG: hypothetical protein MZU91_11035 [Desulfosudis oleivorans]|nr:hypothetical protein [Desulfosudis oleivorans]